MTKVHSKLVRMPFNQTAEEGMRKAILDSLKVREVASSFHSSGKRDVLDFRVQVFNDNGESVYLHYTPTLTWSPKGKLMSTLQELDSIPAVGEELDLDSLVGMEVMALIENVERNGTVYSNIVKLKKRVDSLSKISKGLKSLRKKPGKLIERSSISESPLDELEDDI